MPLDNIVIPGQQIECPTCEVCPACMTDVVSCNLKLGLVFGWAIVIYLASVFTYQKVIVLWYNKKGKAITVGTIFSKLIVAYPFLCLILLGILSL